MDSVIERQRQLHEDIEFLEKSMAAELLQEHLTHKEKINSEHRVRRMMERISEKSKQLQALYEDKDGFRAQEIRVLSAANPLKEFNAKLQTVRDYHRKNPDQRIDPPKLDILTESAFSLGSIQMEKFLDKQAVQKHDHALGKAAATAVAASTLPPRYAAPVSENPAALSVEDFRINAEAPMLVDFTDEEGFGKFLDLHPYHTQYINLKGVLANDYVTYLNDFDNFAEIPKKIKAQGQYKTYLESLAGYLTDFVGRSMPLLDLAKELQRIDDEFDTDWSAGTCPGWKKTADDAAAMEVEHAPVDLSKFDTLEELAAIDAGRLKAALSALGLKCGGTPAQRAARLWSTKGKALADLDKSLFAPAKKDDTERTRDRELAGLEFRIMNLCTLLSNVRKHTKEHVELRMARTPGEMEEDDVGELLANMDADEVAESSNELPYNPKGLPLGWDNKPIPYWLYKLHGLNIKYNCEICGDQKYLGPKAFAKHFQEWKHAAGMRALGIPNTAHFAFVTRMEDALNLWEKLKKDKAVEVFQSQYEEEFEDTQGNVVDKKTYDLLLKQGLL